MANSLRNELLRLPSMPSVGSLLRLYRLRALKQLSQNFLLQPSVIKKIVKSAGDIKNGLVCEVGPGPGGITRSLINSSPKYILLVEKDDRFGPFLEVNYSALLPTSTNHCNHAYLIKITSHVKAFHAGSLTGMTLLSEPGRSSSQRLSGADGLCGHSQLRHEKLLRRVIQKRMGRFPSKYSHYRKFAFRRLNYTDN